MSTSKPKAVLMMDWGIGGLSVYKEAKRAFPDLPVVYVSDAGFTPYGKLSASDLAARLERLILLMGRDFDWAAVFLACNAASTVLPLLCERVSLRGFPLLGMIDPGIETVLASGCKRVAVIGGLRTIEAGVFSERLRAHGIRVEERAAQPLSAFVERGELAGTAVEASVAEILAPLHGAEALLLACTHYPALAPLFARELPPGVRLLDPAPLAVAPLRELGVLPSRAADEFFTSGSCEDMRRSARLAFAVECEPRVLAL